MSELNIKVIKLKSLIPFSALVTSFIDQKAGSGIKRLTTDWDWSVMKCEYSCTLVG